MGSFREYLIDELRLKMSSAEEYAKDARCFERWEKTLPPQQRLNQPFALRVVAFLSQREWLRPSRATAT